MLQHVASIGTRAYPYVVVTPAVNPAIDLATFKSHIKMPEGNCSQDTILQLYLDAAIANAEDCMGLDLITRTYQSHRDYFPTGRNEGYYPVGIIPESFNGAAGNSGFVIRRCPTQAVSVLEYLALDGVTWTTVASTVYYVTIPEPGKFAELLLNPNQLWPSELVLARQNSIRFSFTSGYGDQSTDIPSDIKLAILEHATFMFFNKGDCSGANCSKSTPPNATAIYNRHRIVNI